MATVPFAPEDGPSTPRASFMSLASTSSSSSALFSPIASTPSWSSSARSSTQSAFSAESYGVFTPKSSVLLPSPQIEKYGRRDDLLKPVRNPWEEDSEGINEWNEEEDSSRTPRPDMAAQTSSPRAQRSSSDCSARPDDSPTIPETSLPDPFTSLSTRWVHQQPPGRSRVVRPQMVPLRGIFSPNELEHELYGLLMAASGNVENQVSSANSELPASSEADSVHSRGSSRSSKSASSSFKTAASPVIPARNSSRRPPVPPSRGSSLKLPRLTPDSESNRPLLGGPITPDSPGPSSLTRRRSIKRRPVPDPLVRQPLSSIPRSSSVRTNLSTLESIDEAPQDLDANPCGEWALRPRSRPRHLVLSRSQPNLCLLYRSDSYREQLAMSKFFSMRRRKSVSSPRDRLSFQPLPAQIAQLAKVLSRSPGSSLTPSPTSDLFKDKSSTPPPYSECLSPGRPLASIASPSSGRLGRSKQALVDSVGDLASVFSSMRLRMPTSRSSATVLASAHDDKDGQAIAPKNSKKRQMPTFPLLSGLEAVPASPSSQARVSSEAPKLSIELCQPLSMDAVGASESYDPLKEPEDSFEHLFFKRPHTSASRVSLLSAESIGSVGQFRGSRLKTTDTLGEGEWISQRRSTERERPSFESTYELVRSETMDAIAEAYSWNWPMPPSRPSPIPAATATLPASIILPEQLSALRLSPAFTDSSVDSPALTSTSLAFTLSSRSDSVGTPDTEQSIHDWSMGVIDENAAKANVVEDGLGLGRMEDSVYA